MHATTSRVRNTSSLALLATTVFTTTAILAPTAHAGANASATSAATVAAETLADSDDPVIPNDFRATMGYTPVTEGGMLVNPHGDCSSPVTLPYEFETACKAHDLGYDVLRYAERTGAPLGSWARQNFDAQLHRRMHDACETRENIVARSGCFAMAEIAAGFVDANSFRQGYRSPDPEHADKYLIAGALGITLLIGALAIGRGRRIESAGAAVQA
ncbi:hypothetical protein [Antrihabitans cavernicola]|uniref:Phospholipase n=1 Tax=Antrihabitans cavernicola TaxID=2495913 RepID=A0A5A7SFJ1_9NOCA|nr:hypothetical protein [Spelaeibacter cavernicola]KAA0024209.1 hypothetical protein FOY51_06620 [Spelaeibacter cavernicola]